MMAMIGATAAAVKTTATKSPHSTVRNLLTLLYLLILGLIRPPAGRHSSVQQRRWGSGKSRGQNSLRSSHSRAPDQHRRSQMPPTPYHVPPAKPSQQSTQAINPPRLCPVSQNPPRELGFQQDHKMSCILQPSLHRQVISVIPCQLSLRPWPNQHPQGLHIQP